MINIEIDGKQISVSRGGTVMDGARELGIYIPHFCYHKKLSIAANCRMCLVQVEKAPKPLPACATPVMEGMKVFTRSEQAITAQKGVMEFLLINHPLDCPICDQGGECQLQDLAVGYGAGESRYFEDKRAVTNKNLGSLISTDMTRCIHCTRCVRFGQEIAGVMELGQAGRGEHSEILSFVGNSVDSELSGNMIDICPVGALVSKPFRYSARSWELSRRKSISPHCGLGSNLVIQIKNNKVMRVLPRENESINECWLSDKDRFAYEGLNSEDRLNKPKIKRNGSWQDCDWEEALKFAINGLTVVKERYGARAIGALGSPHSTLEELYLLQKLMRAMGSENIDHRLRQADFRADSHLHGVPWLGTSIAAISQLKSVLIIGSTLRKDHPLIAQRIRQAVKNGMQLNVINPYHDNLLTEITNEAIVAPDAIVSKLAEILKTLIQTRDVDVPRGTNLIIKAVTVTDVARRIASSLYENDSSAVYLGNLAQHHPQYSEIQVLAQSIAQITGANFGVLGEAANNVGAYLANAVPMRNGQKNKSGLNVAQMLGDGATGCKGFLLLNMEPEYDINNPQQALKTLCAAEFVVSMSCYQGDALNYADVLLPIAPFTETSGTFVNTEGLAQSFGGVVSPLGEARPAWKILRVLGNLFKVSGFDYDSSEQIRDEILPGNGSMGDRLGNAMSNYKVGVPSCTTGTIQRIGEVPIYQADPISRRAESLQQTSDSAKPRAWMSLKLLEKLCISEGEMVKVSQGDGEVQLQAACDKELPFNCARIACAHSSTTALGAMFGEITITKLQ